MAEMQTFSVLERLQAKQISSLEAEVARLREEIRISEESQIPVIPRGAQARIKALEDALRVYADPLHWAISRDDLNYKVLSWIGPGATDAGLPNGMKIAREALGDG